MIASIVSLHNTPSLRIDCSDCTPKSTHREVEIRIVAALLASDSSPFLAQGQPAARRLGARCVNRVPSTSIESSYIFGIEFGVGARWRSPDAAQHGVMRC